MILKNKYSEVRSGWKIFLVFLLTYALSFTISLVIGMVLGLAFLTLGDGTLPFESKSIQNILSSDLGLMISTSLSNAIIILSCVVIWKIFEKKKVSGMGLTNLKEGYKEFISGLLFGTIAISIVAIILLLMGNVRLVNSLSKPQLSVALLEGLILFIFVGFGEEILGRAYIMSVLKQTRNKWLVLIISSVIFAILHLGNNGISILAFINLFLVGLLFGYMFMKSKNIWMPIGYHITRNYFQGYIWGFQVSGITTSGLYKIENINNNIINGGLFGPEGGLIVTIVTCIAFYIVYKYYSNNNIDEFIGIEEKEIIE